MLHSKTLNGLGLFQLEILHLISIGKQESFETIENALEEGHLIEYIFEKYRNEFVVSFDNHVYNNETLNSYFQSYSGYISGNETRKYRIMNENDGLLLILALISDEIEQSS